MAVENFELPVGRIVGGNPIKTEQKTDYHTKKPVLKDGLPVSQWRCYLAIPKADFIEKAWIKMRDEAITLFPNWTSIVDQTTGLPLKGCKFSWKIIDGDSPEAPSGSKVPYNKREGYPGHYILNLSTEAFAPSVYKFEGGAFRQIGENEIKCGDYVVANINVRAHSNNDGGLYLNPNGYQLVGYGQAITSTNSDPNTMFTNSYQLPPGASQTPTSSAPTGVQMPTATAPTAAPAMTPPPAMAQTAAQVAPAPQAMPAPAYDFVANAGNAAAPAVMSPPSAPQTVAGIAIPATSSPGSTMMPPPSFIPPAR